MKPERQSGIILYQAEDNRTRIEVRLEGETVWLTQKQMAELFQKDVRTINEHIQNVFGEGGLQRGATIRKFRIVQLEGARSAELTQLFFQTVQNKMHWAVHGQTAAEVIHQRATATEPHMGLTSWKGSKVRMPATEAA